MGCQGYPCPVDRFPSPRAARTVEQTSLVHTTAWRGDGCSVWTGCDAREMSVDLDGLRTAVGDDRVVTDPEVTAPFLTDWTGRFSGSSPAVVRPRSTDEVAAVLAWCDSRRVAVVPQGGNTGLVGGGVPLDGEIVLSLRGLDTLGDVDLLESQVTVGAGVTIAELADHAGAAGLSYGVDLASRESATVGGTVATDAGGIRVIRYGTTRDQLVGVEVVLADGRVIDRTQGVTPDTSGYDLTRLVCGSEGTLGVVTAARVRLVAAPEAVCVALCGFADVDGAVAAVARLRRTLPELSAAELMLGDGVDLVSSEFDRSLPFSRAWPVVVLVEAMGDSRVTERLGRALDGAADDGTEVGESVVAEDPAGRAALWSFREDHSLAISRVGVPHKFDVAVPLARFAAFVEAVSDRVSSLAPEAAVWCFGHVGEGSVHVNVTGLAADDVRVDEAVLSLVVEFGGSISVEHGIGTAKRRWLHLVRSDTELDVYRSLKRTLDPHGILDPNVLLP